VSLHHSFSSVDDQALIVQAFIALILHTVKHILTTATYYECCCLLHRYYVMCRTGCPKCSSSYACYQKGCSNWQGCNVSIAYLYMPYELVYDVMFTVIRFITQSRSTSFYKEVTSCSVCVSRSYPSHFLCC
jgi:hypothetical protein